MSKRHRGSEGEEYVRQYKLDKWTNQCVCCQERGYKPEMPNPGKPQMGGSVREWAAWTRFRTLRRYFRELPLNEDGLCEHCAETRERQ